MYISCTQKGGGWYLCSIGYMCRVTVVTVCVGYFAHLVLQLTVQGSSASWHQGCLPHRIPGLDILQCSKAMVSQCSKALVSQCSKAPVLRCLSARVLRCSSAPGPLCLLVLWCLVSRYRLDRHTGKGGGGCITIPRLIFPMWWYIERCHGSPCTPSPFFNKNKEKEKRKKNSFFLYLSNIISFSCSVSLTLLFFNPLVSFQFSIHYFSNKFNNFFVKFI